MCFVPSVPGDAAPALRRPETFGRGRRILRRSDYLATYASGRRYVGRWLVFFVRPVGGQGCRLGVTITKKTGTAVVRNSLRRKLRELFRRGNGFAGEVDVVVNVRPGAERAAFAELARDFERLASRASAGGAS